MKSNLHSHTQFCDGRNSMDEMLLAAREKGFSVWGFSPHAPLHIPSPCNMDSKMVPEYFKEIDRLRKLFPDIKILAGMEVDFIDEQHGPASTVVKSYGLDYIIGSVHFIPNQKGEYYDIDGSPERFQKYIQDFFENDLNYVVRTYWLQVQRMIKAGGLDIIGHIDKIALNASFINPEIEKTDEYQNLSSDTIGMAIKKGIPIEINTKHYNKYGRFFPHPNFWERIIKSGLEMPVNSDAHYADLVEDSMGIAYTLLNRIINSMKGRDN